MVGPKATRWIDGKSLERQRGRDSGALAKWRRAVYRRDNYTCRRCGATRTYLHAHHIKPYATHPELRFVVENGETLCRGCHGIEHGKDFTPKHLRAQPSGPLLLPIAQ